MILTNKDKIMSSLNILIFLFFPLIAQSNNIFNYLPNKVGSKIIEHSHYTLGYNEEHEVSLASSKEIKKALNNLEIKYKSHLVDPSNFKENIKEAKIPEP